MNQELMYTMTRLAAIADELADGGHQSDAEEITKMMEDVLADVQQGTFRTANWWQDIGDGLQTGAELGVRALSDPIGTQAEIAKTVGQGIYDSYGNLVKKTGDAIGGLAYNMSDKGRQDGINQARLDAQKAMQPGINQAKSQAQAAGQGMMNNDQKVLANRYLTWAKGKGGTVVLPEIYQHAMKHQTPEFANQLIRYLKSQGVK